MHTAETRSKPNRRNQTTMTAQEKIDAAEAKAAEAIKKAEEAKAAEAEALKKAANAETARKEAEEDTKEKDRVANEAIKIERKKVTDATALQKKTVKNFSIALVVMVLISGTVGYFVFTALSKKHERAYTDFQIAKVAEVKVIETKAKAEFTEAKAKAEAEKANALAEAAEAKKLQADAKKAKEDAEAEKAKSIADAESAQAAKLKAQAEADAKALALKEYEAKEEAETQKLNVNRMKEEIFDASKNYQPKGHQQLEDVNAVKQAWAGWQEYNGWHFPLVLNHSGNPGPIKGEVPPEFLSPGTNEDDWSYQTIVLKNPNGSGQYSTKAWATKKRPKAKNG